MNAVSEARANILQAIGNDNYRLALGDYERGRADCHSPQVIHYLENALLFAFVAGLSAGLQQGAREIAKTIGSRVSDRVLKLLGKDAETDEKVADQGMEGALRELKSLHTERHNHDKVHPGRTRDYVLAVQPGL